MPSLRRGVSRRRKKLGLSVSEAGSFMFILKGSAHVVFCFIEPLSGRLCEGRDVTRVRSFAICYFVGGFHVERVAKG